MKSLIYFSRLCLSLFAITFMAGCGGGSSSSQELSSGEVLGVTLTKISGDGQITTPNASWAQPLVVRVTSGGVGISSIPVSFSSTGVNAAAVVNPVVITDSDGYAKTSALAPNTSNAQVQIKASLTGSSEVTFTLETRSYPDTPTMTLRDPVTNSSSYAQQTPITVSIVDVPTAIKWCLSENQNTRPADGNSSCTGGTGPSNGWYLSKPTSFTLSATNGVKTLYIWVADQFQQVSLNPSNASIYLDTVIPSIPAVSLSDQGSGSTTDTASATVNLSVSNDGDASYWCIVTQMAADPTPTAPTRTSGCWVSAKPATVLMANLGLNQTYVWTKDLAGNISSTYGTNYINFTTLAIADPTFTVADQNTVSQVYSRSNTVNLTIGNDTQAVKWCVSESQASRPANSTQACVGGIGPMNGWSSTRPTSMLLSGGDGLKTIYVWVANSLLNTNSTTISRSITVDTIAPAIPLADLTDPNTNQPNFTNQSTVNLAITSDTDAVRWCRYERASNAAPPSLPAWNDACWLTPRPTTQVLGATGSRRVYIYTKDIAHNVSPAPAVAQITYTTTPPSSPIGVIRDPQTNSTTLAKNQTVNISINSPTGSVRWCVSETQTTAPATGTDPCNGGAGPSNGWYTSSPTTFALSAGDALKTVYFWVADGANNVNNVTSSTQITLDLTPPATPTVAVSDPNSGSTTTTNQIIPNLTITADTGAYRWCRIVQDTVSAAPATPALTDTCWVVSRPTNIILDQAGLRRVYVYTRDEAGNVGTAGSADIEYDTNVPTDPTVVLADSNTGLTTYANQASTQLSIGNDTGATRWCVSETQTTRPSLGTSTCTGGLGGSNGWSTSKPSVWSLSAGNGLKRVYVWTANAANSVNNNPSSASITRDGVVPANAVASMSDPNTGSTTNTNESNVNIAISGEDADVTAWCLLEQSAAAGAPAQPAWNNACWTTSKPVTVVLGATGNRRVYTYFRDRAYNISAAAGIANISYSTTAPTTGTLAITDATTSSATYIRQVATATSITGDTGAVKWCLSESQSTRPTLGTSNCLGGAGPSNGWYTTRPTTFNLSSGDGSKTLYMWTADVANNTSATVAQDTITLDTLPSSVPFVTLSDPTTSSTSVTNQTPVNISIQFDTDATRWCMIEQSFASAAPSQPAWNSGCWVGTRPTTVGLGATGVRRVFVYTKDDAHNVSPAAGVSQINYTTTAPNDPVLILSNSSTGSTTLTKDLTVTTSITSPTGTVKWCLSQTQNTRPANGSATCTGGTGPDNGWYTSLPGTFTLSAGNGLKTVYIWVTDNANNTNANTTTGTITVDQTPPATPTVAMTDPNTGSTSQTNQFNVDLAITADTDAVRWCPIIQAAASAAPSTPASNDSCWRSTRPTTQLIDATGSRTVYVFTSDLAGNIGSAGSASINYTITPPADPTVTLTHATTGLSDYARTQSLNVSITGDTGAVKWCISEAQTTKPSLGTSTCNGGAGPSNGWYTARPTAFSLSTGEALKRVYVWTADVSNNVNGNASSATITLDTTPPVAASGSMTDPNTNSSTDTNQSTVNLSIGATADALAWCVIEQAAAAGAPTAPLYNNGCWVTTKPTTQALGATGNRRIYIYTRDRAYLVSTSANTADINYSITAPATPSLSLTDATTLLTTHVRQVATAVSITGDTGAVKWCLSETQTSAPALGTSACTGGQGATNGWHTVRPTTFNLTSSNALKTVYVYTANAANVVSAGATDTITLDNVTPAIPNVSLADPNTSSTAFTNQSSVTLTITSDTDATAWCSIEQASATAAPAAPLYNDACWVGTRPVTQTLAATGNRRVYVYTKDTAQNVALAPALASILYSLSAPNDPAIVLSDAVTGSRFYTNNRTVSISINNPAGAVSWCISQTQSTRPATGTATCNGGTGPNSGWFDSMPSTFQLSTGDGNKTVYIWVADNANNTNSNQSSGTIHLIENAPSAPTVALADANTGSSTQTNQNTVNMTITNDTAATAWCAIADDAANPAPATPSTSDTCWVLSRPTAVSLGATGSRKVYVFLRDPAMNISPAGSATINLSTTPPVDPVIDLSHSVTGLTTYARTTAVNIAITNDTGATRWCVSETQSVKPNLGTSTCVGGSGGSNGWYTARPTTFTLSSTDATKRVYVWIANAANNVNENASSDTIILDTLAPDTFNITGLTGGSDITADLFLGTTTIPTANWAAAPGASSYDVDIKNSAGTVTVCALNTTTGTAFTFSGCSLVDGTTYRLYVTARDDAQNTRAATNNGFSFSVKLNPPGAFNISGISGSQDTTADQYSGTSLPTVSWTASTGVDNYLVRILANDGTTVMCSQQIKASGILSHDYSTTGCSPLVDNTLYNAEVYSRDVAGNIQTATNSLFVFRTDLSAPTINITGNPNAQSISSAANFTFTASDTISGVNAVQCKLDAGSYVACDSVTTMAYTGIADGNHTFTVRAVDRVGLTQTASFSWDIDTVLPGVFTITGATGATDAIADNELRNDTTIIANWTDSSNESSYDVTILNNDNSVRCPTVTKAANTTSHTFTGCPITNPGTYKIQVVARRGFGTTYTPTAMTINAVTDSITATITRSASTVSSGSSVLVTLVGYQNGVQMSSNLLSPTFTITSGSSTGSFTNVQYIGSGTYTADFTGVTAGTAATISATTTYFGGFTSVTPTTVQVLPGAVSAAVSTVNLSASTVPADNTTTITTTVQVRDLNNNPITGASVSGSHSGGVSTITFGSFTETPASSGNYVATFKGNVAGSATNVRATANGTLITQQPTITVFPGPPVKIAASIVSNNLTTHACSGAVTVELKDFYNNNSGALNNVQINLGGLSAGYFSTSPTCSDTASSTTIFLGSPVAPPLYIMPRGPATGTNLTFTHSAGTLTQGTLTVNVAGVLSWIGQEGNFNWSKVENSYIARSDRSGLMEPRSVWYNSTSKYLYVADTYNHRIVRYDTQTKEYKGWVGITESVAGMSCGILSVPSSGAATPGWCTGGTSPRSAATGLSNWDGMLNTPAGITGDATYLYVLDTGNNRIVRYNQASGAFAGWYGRAGAAGFIPTSCESGSASINTVTPNWCYGGRSIARNTAPANTTNWDGIFVLTFNTSITSYADPTSGQQQLIINDTNQNRMVRFATDTNNIVYEGWAGRTLAVAGMTNGYNTTGCDVLNSGDATPGWCKGGTSQAAANPSPPGGCTGPANCFSSQTPYTNYDNMFNTPVGLGIIPAVSSMAYFMDQLNGRFVRFNLNTGKTDAWVGRVVRDVGYQATGGANCNLTTSVDTGWCVGGVPQYSNYRYYTGTGTSYSPNGDNRASLARSNYSLDTDGTYMYMTWSDNRILRFDHTTTTPLTAFSWIGRVLTTPSSGETGCSTTSAGAKTPGWCIGGSGQAGNFDGHFSTGYQFTFDLTPGAKKLYTADVGNSKIQINDLDTGESLGWIGSLPNSPTSWSTTFAEQILGAVGLRNDDLGFGAGSITNNNTNGFAIANATAGISRDGSYLYITDSANNRIKRYNAQNGTFEGWYGKVSTVPTADDDCTGISTGGLTPKWCYGGTPAGMQVDQNTINNGTGEIRNPRDLATDGTYIYVSDTTRHRIVRITKTGAEFKGWLGFTNASVAGMSGFDAEGIARCEAMTTTTATDAFCSGGTHTSGTGNGAMNTPSGLSVDSTNKRLYVADTGNHRIMMFSTANDSPATNDRAGKFLGWIGRSGSAGTASGPTVSPAQNASCTSLAANGTSTAYWCLGGTGKAANASTAIPTTTSFMGFISPQGVHYSGGYIYVADTGGHRIHKFDSTSGAYQGWIGRTSGTKPTALGPSVGAGPTLANDCAPAGPAVGTYAVSAWCTGGGAQASGSSVFDNAFNSPTAVWVDPNTNFMYVVDSGNHRITKHHKTTGAFIGWRGMIGVSPSGGDTNCNGASAGTVTPGWCTGGAAQSGSTLGAFYNPIAITGDTNFIYVTDSLNSRVTAIPK